MKSLTLALAAAVVPAFGTAQSTDWVTLGKDDNKTVEVFVDAASINIDGEIRHVQSKLAYVPRIKTGIKDPAHKKIKEQMARLAFNCKEKLSRMEEATDILEDATSYKYPDNAFPTPWQPVAPDTVMNTEMKYVCAWSKGAQ